MNIPSPLPGRTFASTCVASHADVLRGSSRAPKNVCVGGQYVCDFLKRVQHYWELKQRTTFPLYLFQLAVGRSCRIQNSFYLETKHGGPIIFPPCGHVIFSISCLEQPKYANISRFTDFRKPYILPLSIGLRQIDPFDRQYTVIILRSLSRSQCRRRNCYQ